MSTAHFIQESDMPGPDAAHESFHTRLPTTPLGRWSLWLAAGFGAMLALNGVLVGIFGRTTSAAMAAFSSTYLPYFGIAMLLVGLASGVVGALAIFRQKERSLITIVTVVPAIMVIILVVGELAFPH